MERLFLAIFLSQEAREEIRRAQGQIRAQMRRSKVRWTNPDDAHVTLHFLGDTPEAAKDDLVALLRESEWPRPFPLSLTEVSGFPNKKQPKVIHVGVTSHPNATGLRVRTAKALVELGFEIDQRAWIPHVTLGRVDVQSEVLKPEEISLEPVSFDVSAFVLVRSTPSEEGSHYDVLETFDL